MPGQMLTSLDSTLCSRNTTLCRRPQTSPLNKGFRLRVPSGRSALLEQLAEEWGFGAIGGIEGTGGIDNEPVFPEVLGTSFSFGISTGGVVVGATAGAPGVAQGLTTGPQQSGFLQQPQALTFSRRFGRLQVLQLGAGAASPHDGFTARCAFDFVHSRLGFGASCKN